MIAPILALSRMSRPLTALCLRLLIVYTRYWDWSLDWEDFSRAPIWGHDNFGNDGNLDAETSVGNGHCVIDGPFAGLTAMFYDNDYYPHCLSRGFKSGAEMKDLGNLVRPGVVEDIMREGNFEAFAQRIEHNAHRFVSGSIRGEFSKFTGPYGMSDKAAIAHSSLLTSASRSRILPTSYKSRQTVVDLADDGPEKQTSGVQWKIQQGHLEACLTGRHVGYGRSASKPCRC